LANETCLDSFGDPTGSLSKQARGCGLAERIIACEQDSLIYHARIPSECDREWRAVVECQIAANHTPETCAAFRGGLPGDPEGGPACRMQSDALSSCLAAQAKSVTGSRSTCHYNVDQITSECRILCGLPGDGFSSSCLGGPGLPVECDCNVNERPLKDLHYAFGPPFFAADCAGAARAMANGEECTNRLDCCFTHDYDRTGVSQGCVCTGDTTQVNGAATCGDAARFANGRVVPICPQYEN
jgi:hypothetical protein